MRDRVLIVDDAEMNREMLDDILGEDYSIMKAEDGRTALGLLNNFHDEIAVVLLDLIMPEMNGFEVMDVMKEKGWIEKIPILIISGETAVETERKCFEYGVADFIRKPFDNVLVRRRVTNVVKLFQYQNGLEEKVKKQTKMLRKQYEMLKLQAERLKRNNERIIDVFGTVVEYRNLESGEHIKRVKGFTEILARELMKEYPEYGLTEEEIRIITVASSLHDVGKIAIPDNILLKPGKLTEREFEYMKSHTTRGSELLDNFKDSWNEQFQKISYEICRHHHERYDGKGYPDGLAGEEIPISAQIVSIADVYDALVSERVYKKAFSKEEAFYMIINGECGVFSPKLLECLRNVRKKYEELADRI